MVQKIDEAYRKTDEYQGYLAAALDKYPNMTQSMFDHALACHFGNPKAYRDKKRFPHNPTPPPPSPADFTLHTVTVEEPTDSIQISEVEDENQPEVCESCVIQEDSIAVTDT